VGADKTATASPIATGGAKKGEDEAEKAAGSLQEYVEYLRINEIDDYVAKYPKSVSNATMKFGDVMIFNQYTYHRGLPNVHPKTVRWTLDFRYQNANHGTLRGEKGFLLNSPLPENYVSREAFQNSKNDYVVDTLDRWTNAPPSLRLFETRKKMNNFLIGGNTWGTKHKLSDSLEGAVAGLPRNETDGTLLPCFVDVEDEESASNEGAEKQGDEIDL